RGPAGRFYRGAGCAELKRLELRLVVTAFALVPAMHRAVEDEALLGRQRLIEGFERRASRLEGCHFRRHHLLDVAIAVERCRALARGRQVRQAICTLLLRA